MKNQITICSFYTDNDGYPEHARRLADECAALGLRSWIREFDYAGSWLDTLRLKPTAITRCMHETEGPVLWLDVDGSIFQPPAAIDLACDYMAVRKPTEVAARGRPFYMGCFFVNCTDRGFQLMDRWHEEYIKEPSEEMSMGRAFDCVPGIAFGELPPTYMEIDKTGIARHTRDTVVIHRLSESESKRQFYASRKP